MSIRTLLPRTTLSTALDELRYTQSRLLAHPLAAPFAPTFQALRHDWTPVHNKQLALQEALADARARVDICDEDCDDFASRFGKAVLTIVKDNRKHPLWLAYFGKKSLSAFKRPVLAGQLNAMEKWIPSLQTSPHQSLQDMASELVTLVAAAKKAVAERDACHEAIKHFNNLGERKQFIDQLNGARKEVHGQLAKLVHETIGLPADFADRFFASSESDKQTEEPESVASLKAHITELTEALDAAKARLSALEEQEANQAEAKKAEAEAALAALAEEEAALAKKKAELLAQIQA